MYVHIYYKIEQLLSDDVKETRKTYFQLSGLWIRTIEYGNSGTVEIKLLYESFD